MFIYWIAHHQVTSYPDQQLFIVLFEKKNNRFLQAPVEVNDIDHPVDHQLNL